MFNLKSLTVLAVLCSVSLAEHSHSSKRHSRLANVLQPGKRAELSDLFPVQPLINSWTTSTASDSALPLSDATLKPFKVLKALTHNYTTAPDGVYSMQAHYPAGSASFGLSPQGGFSFYAPGPDSLDLTTAKEATFAYSVLFPDGFDFVKGGKIPGLCELAFPRKP